MKSIELDLVSGLDDVKLESLKQMLRPALEEFVGRKVRLEVHRCDYVDGNACTESIRKVVESNPGLSQQEIYDRLTENKPPQMSQVSAYLRNIPNLKIDKKTGPKGKPVKAYSIDNGGDKDAGVQAEDSTV